MRWRRGAAVARQPTSAVQPTHQSHWVGLIIDSDVVRPRGVQARHKRHGAGRSGRDRHICGRRGRLVVDEDAEARRATGGRGELNEHRDVRSPGADDEARSDAFPRPRDLLLRAHECASLPRRRCSRQRRRPWLGRCCRPPSLIAAVAAADPRDIERGEWHCNANTNEVPEVPYSLRSGERSGEGRRRGQAHSARSPAYVGVVCKALVPGGAGELAACRGVGSGPGVPPRAHAQRPVVLSDGAGRVAPASAVRRHLVRVEDAQAGDDGGVAEVRVGRRAEVRAVGPLACGRGGGEERGGDGGGRSPLGRRRRAAARL